MSAVALTIENLGKRYRIGERERYKALRDAVADAIWAPMRWLGGNSKAGPRNVEPEFIWALRNLSLEIKQGEIVGIIGRNAAGKTTLLKILSRITRPTEGHAKIQGRVGSLLEVGTGFHPELTGRENVHLCGAILGMKKAEIKRKFDEIIGFAEVEKFVDTPVKHYSAGMQIRLGFAVAAHLEPEILMVDEVLAVGDARFQKRCLGRMGDVARSGRTILFVSHDMQSVSILCHRAVLLEGGKLVAEGPTQQIVSKYLASGSNQQAAAVWLFDEASGTEVVKLHAVRVLNPSEEAAVDMLIGEPITLEVEFWVLRKAHVLASFHVLNERGMLLFTTANFEDWSAGEYEPGFYSCRCVIPAHLLTDGTYYITLYLSRGAYSRIDVHMPEVVSFRVIDDGGGRGDYTGQWAGLIRPRLPWIRERVEHLPHAQVPECRSAPVAE